MKRWLLLLSACTPDLGGDPALVASPRILALQAEPAEARPGEPVVLRALIATPSGDPIEPTFAWCTEARAVAENRVAPQRCLTGEAVAPAETTLPPEGCALFGSEPPPAGPGETPQRPADPDPTGGYHQPVRITAPNVPPAMGRVRLRCALPGAPAEIAVRYATEAEPNRNPEVTAQPIEIEGESFHLSVEVGPPEDYLYYDPTHATLTRRTEILRAAWYTTAGNIDGTLTEARWTPGQMPAKAWLVLRDDRGGVTWAEWSSMPP